MYLAGLANISRKTEWERSKEKLIVKKIQL